MFRKAAPTREAWQDAPLAARLPVPVDGAWDRLYAGERRTAMLQAAFSTEAMSNGDVFVVLGRRGSGKSTVALAVCDLRSFQAVYATIQTERAPLPPTHGQCVIVDPVSAFTPEYVKTVLETYAGVSPVILVDRTARSFRGIFDDDVQAVAARGEVTLLQLKLPSASTIAQYIEQLLQGYEFELEDNDFIELGSAMASAGMSLPHVNQVSVDAALSRLQHAQPIDRSSFDEALTAWKRLRGSEEYA
jgi:ABC-type cobalamin/Fe3+-siderophores transport system ATPase subunit